uniref:3'-N-debenzoyl-2'-deoxytaxol N-benzoyltransferase n=1 Tax=Aegilops tauschii TaxID=37682 RepID=M8D3B7_AEGTA
MTPTFAVRRREPVLVVPASPTPRETKRLSDIDSKESLRVLMPGVFVYRGGPARGDDDPVDVIGRALSEALVHYYPLAGRFREVEGGKLVVECTGEGVLFAEADADATRLLCGGFVFGMRINHAMCDAAGVYLFMSAVADLARGLPAPAVAPSWSRGLLDAPHTKHDVAPPLPFPAHGSDDTVMRSFVFRVADIASLKKRLHVHGAPVATTFEVLAALLWRARTVALALPAGEVARLGIIASFRRNAALRLPTGYYGNACVPLRASAPADDMGGSSLGDVVEMIQKAKATAVHVRSAADMLALHGPPPFDSPNMFLLSDLRHVGFHRVDFGWGEPVYGGPSQVHLGGTFFVAVKDGDGEDAVAVPVMLPRTAMGLFAAEIETSLKA